MTAALSQQEGNGEQHLLSKVRSFLTGVSPRLNPFHKMLTLCKTRPTAMAGCQASHN